jgi:hypothetical protein
VPKVRIIASCDELPLTRAGENDVFLKEIKVTGDHFLVYQKEDGLFYWELWGSHHPRGPIARCGHGYSSRQTLKKAFGSAATAMAGAMPTGGEPRIQLRE